MVWPARNVEENIFAEPIKGHEKDVMSVQAAGGITDALRLTLESTTTDRCYLEWELAAVGQRLDGVSGIGFHGSGLVDFAAFHHRPLANSPGVLARWADVSEVRWGHVLPSSDGELITWEPFGIPISDFGALALEALRLKGTAQHQAGENPEGITPI